MKIGYCSAEVKDCQVECSDCKEYWRIELDEFLEKREEIEKWIERKQDKINPKLTDDLAIESKKLRGLLEHVDEFSERYGGWLKYE
ncbi:hypothetical protein [Bacillus toyonensis]|uniref:hypothetical protein n=1 Tax=Bacillus toyonensis TaxID=155322 RepID=UPI0015CF1582|nr:hypothetical protein [Bacillus toyonensis]